MLRAFVHFATEPIVIWSLFSPTNPSGKRSETTPFSQPNSLKGTSNPASEDSISEAFKAAGKS